MSIQQNLSHADIVETRNQRAERGFANARRPDQGYIFSSTYPKFEVLHDILQVFFVSEADILKRDISSNAHQLMRVCRVLQIGFYLQNLHKALKAGDTLLIEFAEVDQFFNGINENADAEQIGQHIRQIQDSVNNRNTAQHYNHNGHELGKRSQPAEKVGLTSIAIAAAGEKTTIGEGKFALFDLFIGKGFDHPDTRERILNLRIDIPDAILAAA